MNIFESIHATPIELIAGFGYLIGHFLLSNKRTSGWIIKMIGAIAWTTFLFQNQNYIFMSVSIIIVLMMLYGFYKWKIGQYNKQTNIDRFFEIIAAVVAISMILRFAFSGIYHLGPLFESLIVTAEILGTILLANKKIAGWYFYIIMSILVGILVIFVNPKPAIILGILEMASIYFYYNGIKNFSKKI
ncbi:MAG: nicotinamide mononucleotide transporter [Candidatus Moraniibacteriota bacterium]